MPAPPIFPSSLLPAPPTAAPGPADWPARIEQALAPPAAEPAPDRAGYARRAYAAGTYRAYRQALAAFVARAGSPAALPAGPALVADYLSSLADARAPATLARHVAALGFAHRALGFPDPTAHPEVRAVLRGIRRTRAAAGWTPGQAPALTVAQVKAMLDTLGQGPAACGDRAYLLVGLVGAFRQAELTGLTIERLEWLEPGVLVHLGPTKTDPLAEHRATKVLPQGRPPYCPVSALRDWLAVVGEGRGPVFRPVDRYGRIGPRALSHTAANALLKRHAAAAGLVDAARYSGHSLRAAFVTEARGLGLADHAIARQTQHRDLRTPQRYFRPEHAFRDHPAMPVVAALGAAGQ